MIVNDKIYGEEEIKEEVLIDLINSKEVQRLKDISQFGLPAEFYHIPIYSRYEHSLGVMILLRRLKADVKEQIAGLIHDVSHTAFSHVIDWVIGDSTKEDYQDNIFPDFLKNSNIPKILRKYGFDYRTFLNLENFSLLEQPIPSLCADRFDYAMREIVDFETKENIALILDNLQNVDGKMVFGSVKAADIFARNYMNLQKEHWAGDQAKARFHILADILKKALDKKIICFEDLGTTDEQIMLLLKKSNDEKILEGLDLLKKGFQVKETNSDEGILLKKKFRYIDPEVLINGSLMKLSKFSEEYNHLLEKEKQDALNDKKIKILERNEQDK